MLKLAVVKVKCNVYKDGYFYYSSLNVLFHNILILFSFGIIPLAKKLAKY